MLNWQAAGVSDVDASDEEGGDVHRLNYGSMYVSESKAMGGMSTLRKWKQSVSKPVHECGPME